MATPPTLDTAFYPGDGGSLRSLGDLLAHFRQAGAMRVSDLHLKVACPPTYRQDGALVPLPGPALTPPMLDTCVAALLTPEERERLARQRAVDGSLTTDHLQFRFNVFHDNDGLAIAIRALDATPPRIEDVGFPNLVWQDILARQHGLVLVTGITGAGKSTTIAALVQRIAQTRPCRIITLEDPIEYRLASAAGLVSQREVGRDVASFEQGLRDALREDPDVIVVGEMRDRESAAWALTAAETGHQVFSTLHTRDVAGTLTRLLDMFPSDRQEEVASQLSMGLSHVICQKLIPRADGKGRAVAMEILNNTYAVANHIRVRKVEQIYSQLQTRTKDVPAERMTTLERSLARLVRAGTIKAEEAERWANHPESLRDDLRHL